MELHSLPSRSYGEERDAREAERLENESKLWSEEEKDTLMRKESELEAWQLSTDSAEALATIPCLTLADLAQEPEYLKTSRLELE